MSTRQYITDVATRHQVFLQRYGNGQAKTAKKVLNRLRRNIQARLAQEPTVFQRQRLVDVLHDIDQLSIVAFTEIKEQALYGSKQLAFSEADYSAKLFDKTTTVETGFILPSDSQLIAAIDGDRMSINVNSAITPEGALDNFTKRKMTQIRNTISDGVTLGQTTQEISKNLSTTMSTLMARQITTVVSTITNHTSSVARQQVYEANKEVLDGYIWIATLDNKTTLICASRDQKVYSVEGNNPKPPAHYGCRSLTIPKVNPKYDLGAKIKGNRPSIGAEGVEQQSSNLSYGGWLKKQPPEFINEALGVERGRLFRSGKYTIDKFVDPAGRTYTLAELERMAPISFIE